MLYIARVTNKTELLEDTMTSSYQGVNRTDDASLLDGNIPYR